MFGGLGGATVVPLKRTSSRFLKWLTLIGALGLTLLIAIFLLREPAKVGQFEGIYSTGGVIPCMCADGIHFLRFANERMIYYADHEDTALIFGRYKKNEDGSYTLYKIPIRPDDEEEILLQIARPNPAFLAVTTPEYGEVKEERFILMRIDPSEKVGRLIANREIRYVRFPDPSTIVNLFYNSSLELIREETEKREEINSYPAESRTAN
ncbi:MAG: hypothetical protein PVJ98_04150 [Akkermansiaceae bacterium]